MTFEEDLAHAYKILRVRTLMEDKTLLSHPDFRSFSLRPDVFEYHMNRRHDEVVIGYHEKRQDAIHINYSSWDMLIYNNSKLDRMQVPGEHTKYRYQTELCEEWHFQESCLYSPEIVTAKVVFNILDSVPTEFEYFQLKVRLLDDIIWRYELP